MSILLVYQFIIYVNNITIEILDNGSNEGPTGRSGNRVTYMRLGKLVTRLIGLRIDKPTVPVLRSRQVTALITAFLKPVKEFLTIGFELEGKLTLQTYYTIASSYNRLNAISGSYPDQQIDFTKVLFSQGKMPLTRNILVNRVEKGLTFKWDASFTLKAGRVFLTVFMLGRLSGNYMNSSGHI
jgi:hypothetical protein